VIAFGSVSAGSSAAVLLRGRNLPAAARHLPIVCVSILRKAQKSTRLNRKNTALPKAKSTDW
jgi:hypothetical protein